MEQIATCSNSAGKEVRLPNGKRANGAPGFTLIEMMVALLILSVSILALTSVTITSIRTNLDNDLRNTAIRLTTEVANDLFDLSFDDLASGSETRNVATRGVSKAFTINWTVTTQTSSLKQIVVTVQYDLRGVLKTNRVVFYRSKAV